MATRRTFFAGEPEQVIHAVLLAPRHQRLARKARIRPQHDAHERPAGTDLPDNPRDLLDAACSRVDVGGAQLGGQQMPAAEHVERQIAVAVVIAVEEASLLMPVQRVVGGVEIEDDLLRRSLVRLQEQCHGQRLDRRRVVSDLVISRRFVSAQFQPVQRRLAGHRCTVPAPGRKFARQHRHQRIVSQLVVVVEVFIAKRDAKDPLPDQRANRMFDQVLTAMIAKAICKTTHQTNRPIGRAQKQRSGIRRHQPGIEGCFHSPTFHHSKIKLFCATLCRHRGSPRIIEKSFSQNNFR
jgi:hypothetical protein